MILQSEISCKSMTCCGSGAVADFFGHSEPIAAPALVNGEVMDLETASATLPVLCANNARCRSTVTGSGTELPVLVNSFFTGANRPFMAGAAQKKDGGSSMLIHDP